MSFRKSLTQSKSKSKSKFISVYDSATKEYQESFDVFLKNTNQKIVAKKKLDQLIEDLPQKNLLIDVGAGNGEITARYSNENSPLKFDRTIALEPNLNLCEQLKITCPTATIISQSVDEAQINEKADCIVCSHVFYYIPKDLWLVTLEKMTSWLNEDGILVLILQNYQTDCMKMIYKFLGKYYNLSALKDRFLKIHNQDFQGRIESIPATVTVDDFPPAYTICEFMLNCFTIPKPPPLRKDIETYIKNNFQIKQTYVLSCHQDILIIKKKGE